MMAATNLSSHEDEQLGCKVAIVLGKKTNVFNIENERKQTKQEKLTMASNFE